MLKGFTFEEWVFVICQFRSQLGEVFTQLFDFGFGIAPSLHLVDE
jgi:hypothetical protein